MALAFSPDGGKLAVATKSGTIQLVDINNWEVRTTLCSDAIEVHCLAFSPSGSVLTANRRGQLLFWDLKDPHETARPRHAGQEEDQAIDSLTFSHDGQTLAVGHRDGIVQIYSADISNGQGIDVAHRATLTGHLDRAAAMSFSPDDRTLATGSWDATVRLWQAASGQEVAVLRSHHGKVEAVAFSSDGTVLATGGQRDTDCGEVFLWRATPKRRFDWPECRREQSHISVTAPTRCRTLA